MANPRVFWAIQAVGLANLGTAIDTPSGYRAARGVQSVSINTNFNLEQVFQFGQLSIYENIEDIPDVEITIDKAVDGYPLIEHLATPAATAASLAGRYNDNRAMVLVSYFDINQDGASGTPLTNVLISGAYVSAINWTVPVQGNTIESVTLVGNNKQFFAAPSGSPYASGIFNWAPFSQDEGPDLTGGGVQRRENVMMEASSYWPTQIPGITTAAGSGSGGAASGQDVGLNLSTTGALATHIQNVNIGVNLGRSSLFELGKRGPYHRFVEFPTEVTCSIELTAQEGGDNINALEEQDNLTDEAIRVVLQDGTIIDLGIKNKLQSINTAGGDTGGGNVTVTYNYSNFNVLVVTHPDDPAGLSL